MAGFTSGWLISGKMFAYEGPVEALGAASVKTSIPRRQIGTGWDYLCGNAGRNVATPWTSATGADRPGWPIRAGTGVLPLPAIGEDLTIYAGSYNGKLYALRPDGEQRWEVSMGGAVRSSPAVGSDGTIYVGSDSGSVFAINPDGTIKWQTPTGRSVRSSPAITGDGAILIGNDDGRLIWLEAENGTIGRQFATRSAYSIFSSPAIASDGTVYFGNSFGQLTALSNAGGSAEAPWPMFRQNTRRQGRLPAGVQAGYRSEAPDRVASAKRFEDVVEADHP